MAKRSNKTPTSPLFADTAAPGPRAPLFRFAEIERKPAAPGVERPIHGAD